MPAFDKAIGVDTGEEAGQVLVVDEWGCLSVEVAFKLFGGAG